MIWTICLIFSVSVLAASLVYGGNAWSKHKKIGFLTPYQFIFGGMFASVLLGVLPIFISTLFENGTTPLQSVLYAVIVAIQAFTVNAGTDFLIENMHQAPEQIQPFYSMYMAILFVIAPLITFGFLLSLFQNLFSNLLYLLHYWGDVYIFSQINEKTILLAKSIRKNHPHDLLVFADVQKMEESEWIQETKEMGALLFQKDILSANFARHSKHGRIVFFISGEERENLLQSLRLTSRYHDRKNTDIYTTSSTAEGELILESADKGNVRIRRVNEVRSLIYQFFYEEGAELFRSARLVEGKEEKLITVVLLGLGKYGTEMVKALSWYCQMDGYRLKLHVFDKDEQAKERFVAQCPELFAPEYEDMIVIHSGIDAATSSIETELAKIPEITYGFVALGSDQENICQSMRLRMLMERLHFHPVIRTLIWSVEENNAISNIHNYRGQNFELKTLGNMEDLYSEKTLFGSDLEKLALERHLKWGEEDAFWRYEYNYRSSMASVIHQRARVECAIPGVEKEAEDRTAEERERIGRMEHRRWSAYVRSEGYVYSGSKDRASRNDLGKMHHDLIPYEQLREEDKRKDI